MKSIGGIKFTGDTAFVLIGILFLPNHELASQTSSSNKYQRFDCWAAVFFKADIKFTGNLPVNLYPQ